jgi:hypothetical protein
LYLNNEEEMMLKGKYGEATRLAMEILVDLGVAYNANKMIKVESANIVCGSYRLTYDAGVEICEKLAEEGASVRIPTSIVTGASPLDHWTEFGVPDSWADKQLRLARALEKIGAIPIWTCTPYYHINVPRFGQQIAWAESNCVIYANSVIGARTNRYASYVDLCAAIVGLVPEFGLHLAENRRGNVLVNVKGFKQLSDEDYPLLGYRIGEDVIKGIPVIQGIPKSVKNSQLVSFGAAMASSGAAALYHVVGVTPEARTLQEAFGEEEPEDKLELGPEDLKDTKEKLSTIIGGCDIDFVNIGCPHSTISEIGELAALLKGEKVHDGVKFWVSTNRIVNALAEKMGYASILRESGVKIMTDSCCLTIPTYLCGFKTMVTNSAKMAHYSPMSCKTNVIYASTSECIKAAITGRVE